jgi:hypothetical protein
MRDPSIHPGGRTSQWPVVAGDIETGYGGPIEAKEYVDGAKTNWHGLYLNYGTAGGCPTTSGSGTGCNGNWTVIDVGYISWGLGGTVFPEIYTPKAADQWTRVFNLWNANQGGRSEVFAGVTGCTYQECPDYTPAQSWNALRARVGGSLLRRLLNFKAGP